ncbi:MAG: T9SS type A sorting domain-containing protein, partial [Crocinitomicaceae bacterium]
KKGDVWFNYTQENIGLPEDHITSIAHESPTVKWIGTFNSGVVRIEEPNANLFDYEIQTLKLYPTIIEINDDLHLSELVNGSITIFNCSGQIVQEQSVQETSEFRLSVTNSGFYYVKLSTNLKTYIFKIVVK